MPDIPTEALNGHRPNTAPPKLTAWVTTKLTTTPWPEAWQLLEDVRKQRCQLDIIHANAVMKAAASSWRDVLQLLTSFQQRQLEANVRSFVTKMAAQASGEEVLWAEVLQDLGGLAERRIDVNDFCRSAALRAMASGQAWRRATLTLQAAADVACFNAAISGMPWTEVIALLGHMDWALLQKDLVTYATILRSGAGVKWPGSILLLQDLLQHSTRPHESIVAGILKAVGGHVHSAALQLLRDMRAASCEDSLSIYNALMGATSEWPTSLEFLHSLPGRQLQADTTSWNLVAIRASAAGISTSSSSMVWRLANSCLPHCDGVGYTALLASRDGCPWRRTWTVLQQLQLNGLQLTNEALHAAMASGHGGWRFSLELQGFVHRASIISFGSLLKVCRDQWLHALHLLKRLAEVEVECNAIASNAALSACEKGSQWTRTVQLFQSASTTGMGVDVIASNAVISACFQWTLSLSFMVSLCALRAASASTVNMSVASLLGRWQWALQIIRRAKIKDSFTQGTLMSSLERSACWSRAMKHIDRAKSQGEALETVTLNSALSAISAGDDLDRWRVATGLLESFATQAEILTWNACLCACSRCAQWLAALGFFLQLQQRSLEASRVTEVTVLEACSSRAPWPHCIALTGAGPTAALNAAAARVSRAAAASAAQLGLLGRLRHSLLKDLDKEQP
ncbi:unnamed protein product [Durusdinium trenchii]|uniref:Pentatricopeptide repeat-containing protein, chloroplastic n=1 Tax=Durusdinium trenchii TaxID=1381693 RepID=A0ABP0RI83_9DINO